MNKIFTKKIMLILSLFLSTGMLNAQLLFNADFNFTGNLSDNGWIAHSGSGTNVLTAGATGLTYSGLTGSGVGNAVLVNNLGGEDANITFTNQNTDGQSVYFSALVKITDATSTKVGDYFLHIGTPGGASFTTFSARVFAKITAGVVNFGISNTSTATYGTTAFAINTTYLIVVKYTISVAGNDPVSLWVIPSGVPATEALAGTPELTNTATAGQNAINAIALRQGSNVNSAQTVVDALKVGLTWADVTPAGTLPVKLEYIKGQKASNSNALNWKLTCLSTNITMDVERATDTKNFKTISSISATQERCSQPFDFNDAQPLQGKNYYRLKMIDIDGKVSYSPIVVIINGSKGLVFVGMYPSIVKGQSTLSVSAAKATVIEARISDMNGKLIKTYKQNITSGSSLITIDCESFAPGVYNLTGVAEDAIIQTIRFVKL